MNLQPLYDLKERLEHAAIAGTGLLQEDFRLKRAVEGLAPLAAASPVFAKISSAVNELLVAPAEERSVRLLDVLSLVDAVVYTQGVTNVSGDMVPIEKGNGKYVPVSYGQLQPLISSLNSTGSGRMNLIQEGYEEHPEYFGDFRILPYVVKGLGDTYAELADLNYKILAEQGADAVPLLKEGFDPAGKKEMVRRVQLITLLAGEKENDWFVNILPETKKEVREAVIQALGWCQDNEQLLIDLCHTERGKAKEAALRALSQMDSPSSAEYWKKEVAKRPNSINCLEGINSPLAADMVACVFREILTGLLTKEVVYDQTQVDKWLQCLDMACGKYSKEMSELWDWIACNMSEFATIVPDKTVQYYKLSVAASLQRCMMETVLWNPCKEVLELARRLGHNCKEWFLCCEFLADMIEQSPEKVFDTYSPYIIHTDSEKKESAAEQNNRIQIMSSLNLVRWEAKQHCYCLAFYKQDVITNGNIDTTIPLNGIDIRWVELLTDSQICKKGEMIELRYGHNYYWHRNELKISTDQILMNLICPEDSAVCAAIGDYLHKRVLQTGKIQAYLRELLSCGWTDWKGVLAHCAEKEGELRFYQATYLLEQLPMSNAEKAAELKQLDELVQSKKVKVWNKNWPSNEIQMMIAKLENDSDMEVL